MIKRMLLMLVTIAAVFGAIFGYRFFMGMMMGKMMARMGVPVETVSVMPAQKESWQPRLAAIGSVRAARGVDLSSESAGMVMKILFKSGETVKEGQPLLILNYASDNAQLRAFKIEAELAHTVYERDKKQFALQIVSKAMLDADRADYLNKQALVKRQQALVEQKIVRAPFAGVVGICAINPGQYVNPGDKLVTLQALDKVYVDFFLPQQDVARLQTGQAVELITDSYPGRIFKGAISAVNPQIERETRNVQAEALVDNPGHELLAGMYVSLEVLAGEPKEYLTLPQAAVAFNPYGEIVFVVQKEQGPGGKEILKAKQKFIVVGETRGDQVAVVSGLDEDELVVASGQMKLKNGTLVKIDNTILPSNEARPQVPDEK